MKKTIAILLAIVLCMSLCTTAFADDGWTIFVYLCGSDLESENGFASENMKEMIEASAASGVRFIVETGGASEWKNDANADELDRYEIAGGVGTIVDRQPTADMGSAQTLADFLSWGVAAYPAAHVGLVLWDHGSGSINGVCFDELNDLNSLSLRDIDTAISGVKDALPNGFDFIGFDACLMGTVETAAMLAPYAKYLIGSQELEPGTGWDYKVFGSCLQANPSADTVTLGKAICDGFYQNSVADDQGDSATLALVDLSKIDALRTAFDLYAQNLYEATDKSENFAPICRAIRSAENYGGNNRSEGYTNMVDLGGLIDAGAEWSSNAQAARDALNAAIVYQTVGDAHKDASGLSVYFPLQVQGSKELSIFRDVCVSTHYLALVDKIAYGFANGGSLEGYSENTPWDWDSMVPDNDGQSTAITFDQAPALDENGSYGFVLSQKGLENTASVDAMVYMYSPDGQDCISIGLTSDVIADWNTGAVRDNFDGYWFSLPDGQNLRVQLVDENENDSVYTAPVQVNDESTNLRFSWDGSTGELQIIGVWDGVDNNGIAARAGDTLQPGDRIVPLYDASDVDTGEASVYSGQEYVWGDGDKLAFDLLSDGDYLYSFYINDIFGGSYVTDNVKFSVDQGGVSFYAA